MRNRVMRGIIAVGTVVAAILTFVYGAVPARGQSIARGVVVSGEEEADEAALEARYLAQSAANNAAAERWKAEQQASLTATDALLLNEALAVEKQGCPEGTQSWIRDCVTELCAAVLE